MIHGDTSANDCRSHGCTLCRSVGHTTDEHIELFEAARLIAYQAECDEAADAGRLVAYQAQCDEASDAARLAAYHAECDEASARLAAHELGGNARPLLRRQARRAPRRLGRVSRVRRNA